VVSAQDHHVHLLQRSPHTPREAVKGLKPGGVTVVVGAGAMGRMHADLALSYRPKAMLVTDLIEARLERVRALLGGRARRLGTDLHTVDPASTDVGALLDRLTDHRGADDVIVAAGTGKAIEAAQHYAGRGAVLNLFGGLKKGEEVIRLDTGIVHYRETVVTGSSGGSPWDVARTLALIASGELEAGAHITRIGDLNHAADLLAMVRAQAIDGKAVVYPHRRTEEILAVGSWTAEDERAYLEA
jgi:L-iditol 2-dehydrogenase